MAKEILCGFGIDVDAVAGWLGSYGGEDSPDDISRGLFAGVSLEVGAGESVGIVGESGSGKTTIARCLVGLATPDEGTIEIAGIAAHEIGALNGTDRRTLRRTASGTVNWASRLAAAAGERAATSA